MSSLVVLFFCFLLFGLSSSARILVIFPYYGASHFFVFEPLLEELASRGHALDVLSYMPRGRPLPNYRDISLPALLNGTKSTLGFLRMSDFDGLLPVGTPTNLMGLWMLAGDYEKVHSLPQVQALANNSYDLVLIEMFNSDLFFGIAYKTGAPVVGLSSCTMLPWVVDELGAPSDPSYVPSNLAGKSSQMTFSERVLNTIEVWIARAAYSLFFRRQAQRTAEAHLGELPPLEDIAANVSLLLVHSHFSFLGHQPFPPSVVEVGGLSLKPPKPLSQDVERLLNDSNGAIYFSMGSVLLGKSMPERKRQMFINAFRDSGKTVLWKLEDAITPHPNNIVTKPWFSQRDILLHPKVELFISHCGNLGLTEAVDAGVPVICIPMYGDQHRNAKTAQDYGFSVYLSYQSLTEDQLRSAINEILTNKKYREIARKVQAAFRDRPMSPLDTAVYWVEYVIKHGPVTRAPYAQMPLWKRRGYDVSAFLFFVLLASAYCMKKLYTTFRHTKSKLKVKQS